MMSIQLIAIDRFHMANSFTFVTLLIEETKSKSCVSFKLDVTG